MAAYDNVPMPGAPAAPGYAAPLLDFSELSKLGQQFQEGQQYGVKRGVQTAFKDGFPTDKDGNPDYNAMASRLLKIGGPEAAQPYFQMGLQQGNAAGNQELLSGQPQGQQGPHPGQPPQTFTPMATNAASGPGAIDPNRQPKAAPSRGNAFDDGETIMVDDGVGRSGKPAPFAGSRDQQGTPPGPTAGVQTEDGTTGQPAAATSSRETANNGPQDRRMVAADRLDKEAARLQAQAAKYGQSAPAVKTLQDRAQQLADQAKQYREAALKDQELTPAAKDLRSGTSGAVEVQKAAVAQSQKTYNGIHAQATQYQRDLEPMLKISDAILSQPEMYTGAGGQIALDINKVRAALGDQKAAVLQEALKKVTATSTLGIINAQRDQLQEAGVAGGRIFAQQVELVKEASPSLENTVYGNRFLVRVAMRSGELAKWVDGAARDYKAAHGGIVDDGFDKIVADHIQNGGGLFKPNELADPRILGGPTAPPTIKSPDEALRWGKSMGLKPNDPFYTPDGRIKHMPPAAPAATAGAMHS